MPRNVLAITHSRDHARMIDAVRERVTARGARFLAFHTDHFPTAHRATQLTDGGRERFFVDVGEGPVEIGPDDSIWYRRLNLGQDIPRDMDPKIRGGAVEETRQMFEGFLTALPGAHVDSYTRVRRAARKSLQQVFAHEVGLKMPRTCLTNDPVQAKAFLDTCANGAIAKMLANWAMFDDEGREHVMMTTPVDERTLNNLDGLNYAPLQFQERVTKAYELRVTVVGSRVFSARIDSQKIAGAEIDWRAKGKESLYDWVEEALPADVERRLLAFCDRTGMQYSACDFIVTPGGEHVFLEANAVGEWFWLEFCSPGFPIAEALVDVLLDVPGARRPIPAGLA